MAVVHVIHVLVMAHRQMAATGAVHVLVPIVDVAFHEIAARHHEAAGSAAWSRPAATTSATCASAKR